MEASVRGVCLCVKLSSGETYLDGEIWSPTNTRGIRSWHPDLRYGLTVKQISAGLNGHLRDYRRSVPSI